MAKFDYKKWVTENKHGKSIIYEQGVADFEVKEQINTGSNTGSGGPSTGGPTPTGSGGGSNPPTGSGGSGGGSNPPTGSGGSNPPTGSGGSNPPTGSGATCMEIQANECSTGNSTNSTSPVTATWPCVTIAGQVPDSSYMGTTVFANGNDYEITSINPSTSNPYGTQDLPVGGVCPSTPPSGFGGTCYACYNPNNPNGGVYGVSPNSIANALTQGGSIVSTNISNLQSGAVISTNTLGGYMINPVSTANNLLPGEGTGTVSSCGLGSATGYFGDMNYVTNFCGAMPSTGSAPCDVSITSPCATQHLVTGNNTTWLGLRQASYNSYGCPHFTNVINWMTNQLNSGVNGQGVPWTPYQVNRKIERMAWAQCMLNSSCCNNNITPSINNINENKKLKQYNYNLVKKIIKEELSKRTK